MKGYVKINSRQKAVLTDDINQAYVFRGVQVFGNYYVLSAIFPNAKTITVIKSDKDEFRIKLTIPDGGNLICLH